MHFLGLSRKLAARLDTLVARNSANRAIESTLNSALVIQQDLHHAIRWHNEHLEDYFETHA